MQCIEVIVTREDRYRGRITAPNPLCRRLEADIALASERHSVRASHIFRGDYDLSSRHGGHSIPTRSIERQASLSNPFHPHRNALRTMYGLLRR